MQEYDYYSFHVDMLPSSLLSSVMFTHIVYVYTSIPNSTWTCMSYMVFENDIFIRVSVSLAPTFCLSHTIVPISLETARFSPYRQSIWNIAWTNVNQCLLLCNDLRNLMQTSDNYSHTEFKRHTHQRTEELGECTLIRYERELTDDVISPIVSNNFIT